MIDKRKYFIFEELYNANPMVLHRFVDLGFINQFLKELNVTTDITSAVIKYEKEQVSIYFHPDEFDSVAETIVGLFITYPNKGEKWNEKIIRAAKDLIQKNNEYHARLSDAPLGKIELQDMWTDMEKQYAQLFKFTWIHNSLDFKDHLFTTRLFSMLEEHISEKNLGIDAKSTFVSLTTPKDKSTHFVRLEKELVNLKQTISKENVSSFSEAKESDDISKELSKLERDFCWLGFGFDGPAWDQKHFFEHAKEINEASAEKDPQEADKVVETLGLNEHQKQLFSLAEKTIEGTELRKEAMFNYYFTLDLLFGKLSHIYNTEKHLFRYVYPDEIVDLEMILDKLPERVEYHIDSEEIAGRILLTGEEGKQFYSALEIDKADTEVANNLIRGQTSYPGFVKGTVKIVNEKNDVSKVEEGDVLVSIATNPELVTAMKKAAAFVTDRGGITCHAAIMSRELKIPCIIGTGVATKVLKDGDVVEVNADEGIIKILG